MLTSCQVVHELQQLIARGLLEGTTAFEELQTLERIGGAAQEAGFLSDDFIERHTVLLRSANGTYSLMQAFPAFQITATETSAQPFIVAGIEEETEEQTELSPYWISISRKNGFKRLHLRHGCGVMPWNCFRTEDIWTLKDCSAHAVCKDCSKKFQPKTDDAESSSSGSSSSEADQALLNTADPEEIADSDEEVANGSGEAGAARAPAEENVEPSPPDSDESWLMDAS